MKKVFGDFASKDYILKRSLYFDNNQSLKGFLRTALSRDVLVVGIDPVWDQDILRIIPAVASGCIWLVSEEEDINDKSPDLAALLRKRPSAYILGHEGSYDAFISKIHNYLQGSNFSNYQHHIAKGVGLRPNMREKDANPTAGLLTMTQQLTRLTTELSGMYGQLQVLKNDNPAFLVRACVKFSKYRRSWRKLRKNNFEVIKKRGAGTFPLLFLLIGVYKRCQRRRGRCA